MNCLRNSLRRKSIAIAAMLRRKTYEPGEVIINAGDDAGEMFFLAKAA